MALIVNCDRCKKRIKPAGEDVSQMTLAEILFTGAPVAGPFDEDPNESGKNPRIDLCGSCAVSFQKFLAMERI